VQETSKSFQNVEHACLDLFQSLTMPIDKVVLDEENLPLDLLSSEPEFDKA
jgi:hypothetical protein